MSTSVEEGETAILRCHYSGMPPPITNVIWLRDKVVLKYDNRYSVNSNGTLTITNTQLSDRGEYLCIVNTTSVKPVSSKSAILFVKGNILVLTDEFFNCNLKIHMFMFVKDFKENRI